MLTLNSLETKFALDVVRQASQLVRQVQAEMASLTLTKGDHSPVTVADFASQAVVAYLLSQGFPKDPLVAEEDAQELRNPAQQATLERVTGFVARCFPKANPQAVCDWIDRGADQPSQRFWTLDPIDGTKGFLRGEQYAVALALVVDGQVELGVLGCPNLSDGYRQQLGGPGSLVVAVRGQGAWTTSLDDPGELSRLRVSKLGEAKQIRILRSFESGHTNASLVDQFASYLEVQAAPVLMDSQGKYAVLAAGEGDLIVRLLSPDKPDYLEKIWDQAAGSLIVEEAGGRITDLDGRDLDFTAGRTLARNRGVLASNGYLHPIALQTFKELGA
jgi:3'(2'), 5'-bisphosphate nucleotidase